MKISSSVNILFPRFMQASSGPTLVDQDDGIVHTSEGRLAGFHTQASSHPNGLSLLPQNPPMSSMQRSVTVTVDGW